MPYLRKLICRQWSRKFFNSGIKIIFLRNQYRIAMVLHDGVFTKARLPNGKPGTHHIEARVFKDFVPRFQTMKGKQVIRKAGWDCHGLPVEIAVEKDLGFTGKADIEKFGVAAFNDKCRESVQRHVDEFTDMTKRMGFGLILMKHIGRCHQSMLKVFGGHYSKSGKRDC
jgi:isoleucyl-tRNA synthetase